MSHQHITSTHPPLRTHPLPCHHQAKLADLTGSVPAPRPAPAAAKPDQTSHINGRSGAHGARPTLGGPRSQPRDCVWKYKDSRGTLQGPVDVAALQQLVARGELRWESRVWHPWRGEVVVREAVRAGAGGSFGGADQGIRRPRWASCCVMVSCVLSCPMPWCCWAVGCGLWTVSCVLCCAACMRGCDVVWCATALCPWVLCPWVLCSHRGPWPPPPPLPPPACFHLPGHTNSHQQPHCI
jgi:hypothetical protein